jgi:putative endonuclease
VAAWALRLRGYRVLARRVRTPAAEVDLLCRRGDVLVLVEVKRRRGGLRGTASESLGPRQRERLTRAAGWLEPRHPWARAVRVDLVAIDGHRLRVVQHVERG